jgi:phage terminase large subunit GpA-like protein
MMDAFSDPRIEMVVVMGSAQFGKTEILNNVIGFFVDHDPSPILVVEPTIEVGKAWSKDRLSTMIRDTPALREKVADVKSRDSDNTVLHKSFYGGHITVAGANSAASLRARPIRIILCDDIDAFPASAGTEGDPVDLAAKRTTAFWNRKIGLFSTPTDEGLSRIEKAYNGSDKRKYWVPCIHCGEMQILAFENLKWPKGEPEKAVYTCPHCEGTMTDADKPRMLQRGEWRAEAPEVKKIAGFWINELYSPWVSFSEVAEKFYSSRKDPMQLKVFKNTSLGEVWKQVVMAKTHERLSGAIVEDLPPMTVPAEAFVLTCGIDPGMSGYWFVVRAWSNTMTSWLIHYGFLPTEAELDRLIFETQYPRAGGGQSLGIWRVARDTGGGKKSDDDLVLSMTEESYWWIVRNYGRGPGLYGTKGASTSMPTRFRMGEPLMQTPSGKALPNWFRITTINTDAMKDYFHYGLDQAVEKGINALYLHSETERSYFDQVTAEEKRIDSKKGVAEWVKIRRDNHYLDAEILAISCAQPQWVGGGVNLLAPRRPKQEQKKKPAMRRDEKRVTRW